MPRPIRTVRLLSKWPGGTLSHRWGHALCSAVGLPPGWMTLVTMENENGYRVFEVLTDRTDAEIRKGIRKRRCDPASLQIIEIGCEYEDEIDVQDVVVLEVELMTDDELRYWASRGHALARAMLDSRSGPT